MFQTVVNEIFSFQDLFVRDLMFYQMVVVIPILLRALNFVARVVTIRQDVVSLLNLAFPVV